MGAEILGESVMRQFALDTAASVAHRGTQVH